MPVLLEGFDFTKAEVSLRFKVGQQLLIEAQIVDDLSNPVDITGRTYEIKIGPSGGAADLTLTGVIINAVLGLVTFTSGSTSGLTPGSYYWEAWENTNNYLWGGPVSIVERKIS